MAGAVAKEARKQQWKDSDMEGVLSFSGETVIGGCTVSVL